MNKVGEKIYLARIGSYRRIGKISRYDLDKEVLRGLINSPS